ncbi:MULTISPECIES: lysophospholipid acyltransferase family protein [unclassified Luteimonas]|uniref:lysophospholipid acyltransferase family protein n=1 Tax=unclassified Luteimonas TaxID=2629088 RepID=UPI0015FFA011|nr:MULTISPECIES: lysophospholipid acyltransferase family protein [unclassified Luteimonas]MBB1473190.1 1-acyl-sn-glycerol-3-phosphate acyltransferase [Luteimonas sp. MC1782]MBB6598106.1 1-acyl-sn-glycerol-3-phosphate acyltransferase [Luteimonas sp. MC1825]QOC88341.1 1-acyl-sn-glycerol-3-phosphate acyltransferase [Luteimonas sp. MC1825]
MRSPIVDTAPAGGWLLRGCRRAVRAPLLLGHLLILLPLTMLVVCLPLARIDVGGEDLGHRVIRAWQAGLMRVFGFRLRRIGTPLPGATMFVANHVSWIDISALHSQRMMGFVAKHEIAGWPLIGWLAGKGETLFHERGSRESLDGVLDAMLARLRGGHSVGVFPEGRTRDGHQVGPFHARIFLAAVEAGVPVQPVALRYGEGGSAQHVVAFGPRENMLQNLLRLMGEPSRVADVVFLEPVAPGDAEGRARIARIARDRIDAAMRGA